MFTESVNLIAWGYSPPVGWMLTSAGVSPTAERALKIEIGFVYWLTIAKVVPAGAVPKDGPSAGVAMTTALVSVYTDTPVRRDTAMTGEISLAGLVLPVGGIKEKVLAAHRAGLHRVILPEGNRRDVKQIPEEVRRDLDMVFASRIEEVLEAALTRSVREARARS